MSYDHTMTIIGIPNRILWRKPLSAVHSEVIDASTKLVRKLTLFDLLAINFGGAIGTGLFAFVGLIASQYAGPSGCISWLIAGLGCSFSGLSYAELSGLVPSSGGAYAFTYVALGELPALVVAWLLTLEFGVGASAVARSWGEKVETLVSDFSLKIPGLGPMLASLVMAISIWMVISGIEASKRVVNISSSIKMLLVRMKNQFLIPKAFFMLFTCLYIWDPENLQPWAPFGAAGAVRASPTAFFAFLGFEEVCLLSLEAVNPESDVPLSIILTLAASTIIHVVASLALSGVLPASDLDPTSGFSEAFFSRGIDWAGQIAAIGEIVVLPLVVFVSFMGQPRLMFSMAEDGLLPPSMAEVNANGGLVNAAIVGGGLCMLTAMVFSFSLLGELCSAGALLSLIATNAALLIFRCGAPGDDSVRVMNNPVQYNSTNKRAGYMGSTPSDVSPARVVLLLNVSAMIFAVLGSFYKSPLQFVNVFTAISALFFVYYTLMISRLCSSLEVSDSYGSFKVYRVPFVPWLPALGTLLNYMMLSQISWSCAIFLFIYVCTGLVWYACYGVWHTEAASQQWVMSTSEDQDITERISICKSEEQDIAAAAADNLPNCSSLAGDSVKYYT